MHWSVTSASEKVCALPNWGKKKRFDVVTFLIMHFYHTDQSYNSWLWKAVFLR